MLRRSLQFYLDVGDEAVAGAFKMENVARGGLDGGDGKMLAADDGGEREFTGVAEIAERIFKAADGHVGDFADGVGYDFGAVHFELGGARAEDAAGEIFGERLGEAQVDEAAGIADEAHAAEDLGRAVWWERGGGAGLFDPSNFLVRHGSEDVRDGVDDGIVYNRINDKGRGCGHWG